MPASSTDAPRHRGFLDSVSRCLAPHEGSSTRASSRAARTSPSARTPAVSSVRLFRPYAPFSRRCWRLASFAPARTCELTPRFPLAQEVWPRLPDSARSCSPFLAKAPGRQRIVRTSASSGAKCVPRVSRWGASRSRTRAAPHPGFPTSCRSSCCTAVRSTAFRCSACSRRLAHRFRKRRSLSSSIDSFVLWGACLLGGCVCRCSWRVVFGCCKCAAGVAGAATRRASTTSVPFGRDSHGTASSRTSSHTHRPQPLPPGAERRRRAVRRSHFAQRGTVGQPKSHLSSERLTERLADGLLRQRVETTKRHGDACRARGRTGAHVQVVPAGATRRCGDVLRVQMSVSCCKDGMVLHSGMAAPYFSLSGESANFFPRLLKSGGRLSITTSLVVSPSYCGCTRAARRGL